jgi:hypothetical protein
MVAVGGGEVLHEAFWMEHYRGGDLRRDGDSNYRKDLGARPATACGRVFAVDRAATLPVLRG